MKRTIALVLLSVVFLAAGGCAINPATGQRQLMMISEADEARMGRQADPSIVAQFGLYQDDALQTYVSDLGQKLAARSERPDLNWTFRVLDDPLVNAFALPGGYIYVTRGILAHFENEAQLASVLGHEIGHVTGRHSAEQLSKQQFFGVGYLAAGILAPEAVGQLGGLLDTSLGLMFLKFGRDDERQADDLGLRYMIRAGYNPAPMADVFRTLRRVGREAGQSVPGWLSTHPDPENREGRINEAIAAMNRDFSSSAVRRDEYLARIDDIVFGRNPRHGYFKDSVFYHPDMKFRLDFPQGWKTQNMQQAVLASTQTGDAILQLSLSSKGSAAEALREFMAQEGVTAAGGWNPSVSGMTARGGAFSASLKGTAVRGRVAFVEYDGKVFGLLGVAVESSWSGHVGTITASIESFARVTDPAVLSVQPRRLRLVNAARSESLEAFAASHDATVPVKTLAIINGVWANEPVQPGRTYKVVQGGNLP